MLRDTKQMTLNGYQVMFEECTAKFVNVHCCNYIKQECFCYYNGGSINNTAAMVEMQCAKMATTIVLLLSQMRDPIPFCTFV